MIKRYAKRISNEELRDLIIRMQTGEDTFAAIEKLYKTQIDCICRQYTVRGLEEDDIRQELRIALWEGCLKYKREKEGNGRVFTFLYVVISNRLKDLISYAYNLRSRTYFNTINESAIEESYAVNSNSGSTEVEGCDLSYLIDETGRFPAPGEALDRQQAREVLEDLVARQLSSNEALVLIRWALDDFKYKEIAKITGYQLKKIDNCLYRAKTRLAEYALSPSGREAFAEHSELLDKITARKQGQQRINRDESGIIETGEKTGDRKNASKEKRLRTSTMPELRF